KEVMPEGLRAMEAAGRKFGIQWKFDEFDWSCDYYKKHGRMMPEDALDRLAKHDAVFFGAAGWPDAVPDHISLWGLLIPFRRGYDQYVNLRPVRLMPGMKCPLANRKVGDIDFWVVRENSEGEYSSVGGRMYAGTEREFVTQQAVFSRLGDQVERHLDLDAVLGRAREGNGREVPAGEDRLVPHRHPVRALHHEPRPLRRRGRLQSLRRHPLRSRPRSDGNHRHRALGQHESREEIPVAFRACARLGAR